MDWANERYVRIYVRDTAEWMTLDWRSRALLWEVMRKCDRAGVLTLGPKGARALAVLVGWPPDVVDAALTELVSEGKLTRSGDGGAVVVVDFEASQESRASDRLRQAESRARRRERALGAAPRDVESRTVTVGHEVGPEVTRGHTESHGVTPCCAVPSSAVPSSTSLLADARRVDEVPPTSNPKRQRPRPEAPPMPFTLAALEAAFRETLDPERAQFGGFDPRLAKPLSASVRAFAAAGYGLDDARLVGSWARATWSPGAGIGWPGIATVGKLTGWAAKARAWDSAGRPVHGPNGRRVDRTELNGDLYDDPSVPS